MFDKDVSISYNNERCPDALDVRPILYAPGKSLSFRLTLDLSDLDFNGGRPVTRPVAVEGTVRNRAGVLTLDLSASSTLNACCDRCGKRFPLDVRADFGCTLAETLENDENDEIVLLRDGCVDVAELARSAFILNMDAKTLCSEDCKGLCPRCGANLNEGPCGCEPERDPRWAALAALLEPPEP